MQSRTLIETNSDVAMHRQAVIRAQNVPVVETALRSLLSHEAELPAAGVHHAAVFGSVARVSQPRALISTFSSSLIPKRASVSMTLWASNCA